MSKLEELIRGLCPDGVTYTKLKDAVYFESGYPLSAKSFSNTGLYNCIKISDISDNKIIKSNNFINELPLGIKDSQLLHGNEILVGMSGSTGKCGFNYDIKEAIVNQRIGIIRNRQNILVGYLKHLLVNKNFTEYCFKNGTGPQNNISKETILRYEIPLPPLEVQQEIVRILDSFTEFTTELTVELTAELTARKQQYDYYRDELLTFNGDCDGIVWRALGEIATIARGASPRPIKNFITESEDGINWIKIGDVLPNTKYISATKEKITPEGAEKSRRVYSGDFILSNSMSFGRPYILKIDGCIHDGWLSISGFEELATPDYLYYVLISNPIQREMEKKASSGGAVQNLNADIVRNIKIPLPPISIQKRLANILDHFDVLCNDLVNRLPAEIEARQKQYEYYRDKLLTFKKLA